MFFGSFQIQDFNDRGQFIFRSSLANDSLQRVVGDGFWVVREEAVQHVASSQSVLAGVDETIQWASHASLNDIGGVALSAETVDGQQAIYVEASDGFEAVVRTGGVAPGAKLAYVRFDDLQITNDRSVIFSAELEANDAHLSRGSGIWTIEEGKLTPIVYSGQEILGGEMLDSLSANFDMTADPSGIVAYSTLSPQPDDARAGASIWSYRDGASKRLAKAGDPAPGTGQAFARGASVSGIDVAPDGRILFSFGIDGHSSSNGIWKMTDDGIEKVAITGESVVGGQATINGLYEAAFAGRDEVALRAELNFSPPMSEFVSAALIERNGEFSTALQRGEPLPDPDDAYWDLLFYDFEFNDRGMIAFSDWVAEFGTSIRHSNRLTIGLGEATRVVLQSGDALDIGLGDIRIVDSIWDFQFNNAAQLAVVARFTDGSSAVLLSEPLEVPEPSSLALAAMLTAAIIAARAHRSVRRRKKLAPALVGVCTKLRDACHPRRVTLSALAKGLKIGIIALGVATATPSAKAQSSAFRTLAVTGQPAPGTDAEFVRFFDIEDFNDRGHVAFRSELPDD
ncbi:MAG: hypothetical protein AAF961_10305, partial [Planctomycetota bacterium]